MRINSAHTVQQFSPEPGHLYSEKPISFKRNDNKVFKKNHRTLTDPLPGLNWSAFCAWEIVMVKLNVRDKFPAARWKLGKMCKCVSTDLAEFGSGRFCSEERSW